MKSKLSLFILALVCMSTTFAQRFAIQPGILNFQVEPGNTQTQVIRITNITDKKVTFQAYLADWLRDSLGGHEYYRPDTLKRSCASWVVLNKNLVEVAPMGTEELLVVLRGPADAKSFEEMKWAMLFLQTVQEKDSSAAGGTELKTEVRELMRIGIHIYQTPSAINKTEAKLVSFEADTTKNAYVFHVENAGQVMLQCKSYVTLTNVTTGQEYKIDRVEFPVFPDGKRYIKFIVPDTVPRGKYSALAILDIGEDEELLALEKSIELK
jgi:P pilus assembly chaperone PapD